MFFVLFCCCCFVVVVVVVVVVVIASYLSDKVVLFLFQLLFPRFVVSYPKHKQSH